MIASMLRRLADWIDPSDMDKLRETIMALPFRGDGCLRTPIPSTAGSAALCALAGRASLSADSSKAFPGGKAPAGAFLSVWKPGAEKMEKITELDDRKVSDWIRHVLVLHLYGMKGSREMENNNRAMCPDEGGMDG